MAEIERENKGLFTWTMVDASTREGVKRLQELRPGAGRQIPVPGVVVNGVIEFDCIPETEEFTEWLMQRTQAD